MTKKRKQIMPTTRLDAEAEAILTASIVARKGEERRKMMTSFSEICERIDNRCGAREAARPDLLALRDYIIMVRDSVFPALLACAVCDDQDSHYDKRAKALIQKALAQLEDM